jgi:hypothetical protein
MARKPANATIEATLAIAPPPSAIIFLTTYLDSTIGATELMRISGSMSSLRIVDGIAAVTSLTRGATHVPRPTVIGKACAHPDMGCLFGNGKGASYGIE